MNLAIVVPTCDCIGRPGFTTAPTLHRPGCPRIAAIREKYGVGPDSKERPDES